MTNEREAIFPLSSGKDVVVIFPADLLKHLAARYANE